LQVVDPDRSGAYSKAVQNELGLFLNPQNFLAAIADLQPEPAAGHGRYPLAPVVIPRADCPSRKGAKVVEGRWVERRIIRNMLS
jgi:hypothetical protein